MVVVVVHLRPKVLVHFKVIQDKLPYFPSREQCVVILSSWDISVTYIFVVVLGIWHPTTYLRILNIELLYVHISTCIYKVLFKSLVHCS